LNWSNGFVSRIELEDGENLCIREVETLLPITLEEATKTVAEIMQNAPIEENLSECQLTLDFLKGKKGRSWLTLDPFK